MKIFTLVAMGLIATTSLKAQVLPQSNIVNATYSAVEFHDITADEYKVVSSLFATYLQANPSIKIKTALMDLQGKRVASMAVQFVSPTTCVKDSCYTTLLKLIAGKWQVSMNSFVSKLELETSSSRKIRKNETEPFLIRVNNYEIWQSSPNGSYHSTSWGTGRALAEMHSVPLPKNVIVPGKLDDWYSDVVDNVVILQSKICSEPEGCKTIAMVAGQPGASWRTVLETYAVGGRVAISNELREPMRDILIDGPAEYNTWRWDDKSSKYKMLTLKDGIRR